jgi:nitrogen fixation NifU-like protein
MYSDEILKHFREPQNVGQLDPADGFGIAHGGEQCPHDLAHFWIRVESGRISEVRHKTKGCPVAIAASSLTSAMVVGKSLEEAERITAEVVAEALGSPERKLDSIVGPQALREAIADYRARQG